MAQMLGLQPVIRLGTADAAGPDSSTYGAYLRSLDAEISSWGDVSTHTAWAIIGPNEPQSECWVAPECCSAGTAPQPPNPPPPPGPPVPRVGRGACAPDQIRLREPRFSERAAIEASCICAVESGGNLTAFNNSCVSGGSADYSVGLFQINLHPRATFYPRCSGGFDADPTLPLVPCIILDQARVDQCVIEFEDEANLGRRNVQEAYDLSRGGANWCAWSASGPQYCNLCP